MRSIALFGGTFNPIHNGHLMIAEAVRERLGLDQVIFIPANQPPHKESDQLADANQRYLMVHLATVSNPSFEVSDFEIRKGGRSYSIDTIRHFKELFGEGTRLYFIVGADMLQGFHQWKDIGEILKLCKFVVVPRTGFDVQKAVDRNFLASSDAHEGPGLLENLLIEDVATVDISATELRKRIKGSRSLRYLVPEPVEQFIQHHGLYR